MTRRATTTVLALDDVRAMLRLVHELHEAPPDPLARKTHLLESLCRLLPADAGAALVAHVPPRAPPDRPATVLTAVYAGPGRPPAHPDGAPRDAPAGLTWTSDAIAPPWRRLLRPAAGPPPDRGARAAGRCAPATPMHDSPPTTADTSVHAAAARPTSYCLYSLLPIADAEARLVACLSLRRAGRPFTRRDRDLVHALHRESRWVYRHDVPLAAPMVLSLSPRPRETLQLLLAGHSEKQIAARLKLSTNTVHHYVKSVYRHFGVSSRSELLARWVKES